MYACLVAASYIMPSLSPSSSLFFALLLALPRINFVSRSGRVTFLRSTSHKLVETLSASMVVDPRSCRACGARCNAHCVRYHFQMRRLFSSTCIENQKDLANTHELFHVLVCPCVRLQDAAARLAPVRHQTQSTSNTRWVLPLSHNHFAESVSNANHRTMLTKAPPAFKRTRGTCLRFELGVASAPSGEFSGS